MGADLSHAIVHAELVGEGIEARVAWIVGNKAKEEEDRQEKIDEADYFVPLGRYLRGHVE